MHRQNPSGGSDGKKSSSRQPQQSTQGGRLLPEQIPQCEPIVFLYIKFALIRFYLFVFFNLHSHK